jgi:SAM-dependent methyltransferase
MTEVSVERSNPVLVKLAKIYLSLAPVQLQPYQAQRKPFQRAEMEYDDERGTAGFRSFFPNLAFKDKKILDYGSGYGGRTVYYAELGAEVAGTEVSPAMIEEGRAFAERKGLQVDFRLVGDMELPFPDMSFDSIFSFDVFEHVRDLESSLRECMRVLKPGGHLYAVFPPFYQILGGSHLHGYLSRSPAPNVLFPCSVLRRAAKELMDERHQQHPGGPLEPPAYPLWGMNGITISRFEEILKSLNISDAKVQYLPMLTPHFSKWHAWKIKYWAFPFNALTYIPWIRETFNYRIHIDLTR